MFVDLAGGEPELEFGDHSAALFVNAMQVWNQTKHTYVRNFVTIFRKLGWTHPELTLLGTALRSQGSLIPQHQARPMSRSDVDLLFRSLKHPFNLLVVLAWKTASRWDDIIRLTKESFIPTNMEDEIIIYFGMDTKTSRGRPFRPDMYAVIRGDYTPQLRAFLGPVLLRAPPHQPLFPYPTE